MTRPPRVRECSRRDPAVQARASRRFVQYAEVTPLPGRTALETVVVRAPTRPTYRRYPANFASWMGHPVD